MVIFSWVRIATGNG